jgi:hypothetical protein
MSGVKSIDDFWAMTPRELFFYSSAFRMRQEQELEMLAWQTCHMLSPHIKKGHQLTPDKLLGRKPKEAKVQIEIPLAIDTRLAQDRESFNAMVARVRAQRESKKG